MKLFEIAHSRTGDKGNTSTISLIPYKKEDFDLLKKYVTADKVSEWFKPLGPIKVTRYEFFKLPALNFVIENALRGGVTYSLNIDRHGKSFSSALLEMNIPDK
ncbi:AtuA-related protein [Bombilactobacillus bombi]|uniref:AtuA-related protein n=1 Tax=Bombilactobacillus bombi TaxID=1303590 RepID=UPI0015E5F248|nr:hypothetical protein [Bombilactobacillus bombi]MBA1434069.1 hypothetical protein [Bombilactobacillus bombi]